MYYTFFSIIEIAVTALLCGLHGSGIAPKFQHQILEG